MILLKKFIYLLLVVIFTAIPVSAKQVTVNKLDYFNLAFFEKFNDEILVNNLLKVYENNNDLKAVNLKVTEAQRIVKMSLANELPNIAFDGYISHTFNSSDQRYGAMTIRDYTQTRFLLPLTMNYEIDIWGKNRLKTKSYKKRLEMMQEDERAIYIALSSAFASDYYNLIKTDQLIELQKALIKTQEEIYEAVKTKYEYGTANEFQIIQSEKMLTYLKEELNNLLEKQDVLQNQINVLLSNRAFEPVSRMDYSDVRFSLVVPESIKPESIEKRPDWVKSELDLKRIGLDIKVARRELLPSFNIVGNLGFNMYNLSSGKKFLADLAVMPSWDLFTGGRKIQYLKLNKDEYEIALQNYDKVILTSIKETNDALYSLKNTTEQKSLTENRLNLDKKEVDLVFEKVELGTADNLDKLVKRKEYIITQKELVSLTINEIIASINLYQALGGIDFMNQNTDL